MTLAYHPEFKASFEIATLHYAEISLSLSDRFRQEIIASVGQIASGMVAHAVGPHGFRCYRCKRFPYLVYYEFADDVTLLLAVIHVREHPIALKNRLQ